MDDPTEGDPFGLRRFVRAQDGVHADVVRELAAGRKRSHWMWFVFPQVAGLGRSAMAQRYAIGSLAEARAYLGHPVLGPRLRDCTDLLLASSAPDAESVFGDVDALKLRSSMILFASVQPSEARFGAVLDRWFGGVPDRATLALL